MTPVISAVSNGLRDGEEPKGRAREGSGLMARIRHILLFLLAVAPLVGFQAYTQLNLRASREAELGQEARQLLDLLETEQHRIIDNMRDIMAVLGTTAAAELAGPDCQAGLERLNERIPSYLTIEVTDLQGTVRCATDRRAIGVFLGHRASIQRALASGGFSVGEFGFAIGIGKAILPFGLPYTGPDGVRAGVIAGLLDLSWLEGYLARKPLPANTAILLTDGTGAIMARVPPMPELIGQPLPERFRHFLEGDERKVVELTGFDDVDRVVAYSPPGSGGRGVMLAVGIGKEAAMRSVDLAALRSMLLFLAVLALSAACGVWFIRRVAWVRDSERRLLKAVIANLPSGVLVAEAPTGKLVLHNEAADRVVGAPLKPLRDIGEYASHTAFYRDGTAYRAEDYPLARAILHGETVKQEEMLYRHPDGGVKTFVVNAAPLRDRDGRITLGVASVTDITERKRLEDDLRAAKAHAEQANLAKSKFLAAASHDLRQPMQSLFFFAEALRGHVHDQRGQDAMTMLERGLDTLKGLLEGLLDMSRLDAGGVKPTVEDFAVKPVLDQIGASFAPIAMAKGLELQVAVPGGVAVRSDRSLLGRMVRNLVENAIKYTESGVIRLECRVVDGCARLEVRDSGIGIPPDHLTRIFDEFHQVSNSERDRSRGLGLGLSIVRRLSELLDHPVNVRSTPGAGSVFSVDVPLGQMEVQGPKEPEGAVPKDGNGRFAVLVDDDEIVLLGLQSIVHGWGYETLSGGSVEQVLDRVKASKRIPDIIIADYRLREGRTGIEAIQEIRRLVGAEVPAIVLTGETGMEWQQEATGVGVGVAFKPVTPQQLHQVLRRLLKVA